MKIPNKVRAQASAVAVDAIGTKSRRMISRPAHVLRGDVNGAYLLGWEEGRKDADLISLLADAQLTVSKLLSHSALVMALPSWHPDRKRHEAVCSRIADYFRAVEVGSK